MLCALSVYSVQAQITEFEQMIQDLGMTEIQKDWSLEPSVAFAEPNCAYVNITGISDMPRLFLQPEFCALS